MEQSKVLRKEFWEKSGGADAEKEICFDMMEKTPNGSLSFLDPWLTLLCC